MDDRRSLGIYLIMNRIDSFKIDDLEDRVCLQKVIYLLQLLGIDFRFRFGWYLRGPYSRELALCSFAIKDNVEKYKKYTKSAIIRDIVNKRISKLKTVIKNKPESITISKWLELISSIHYLKHISFSDPRVTIDNIGTILMDAKKSEFPDDQIKSAWGQLEYLDLIRRKNHKKIS